MLYSDDAGYVSERSFLVKNFFKKINSDLIPNVSHLKIILDSPLKIWFFTHSPHLGLDHRLDSFPKLWVADILLGIAHQSHSLRSVSEDPHWLVRCFQQQSKLSVEATTKSTHWLE